MVGTARLAGSAAIARSRAGESATTPRLPVGYQAPGSAKAGTGAGIARIGSAMPRRQWRAWFEKAGATVRMTAPGYTSS